MDLAVKDLKRHLGRFLTTVVGVGLLFGTVLAMNGIYRGVVFEGISLIESINPDLWVVERFRGGPFSEQSTLAEDFHYSVAAVPGVAQASPYIAYPVEREIGGKSKRFTIIGYDVFGGLGGPTKLTAGRGIAQGHYEAVAHKKLGVSLGEKIPLGLHPINGGGFDRRHHLPGWGTGGLSLAPQCPGGLIPAGQRNRAQPAGSVCAAPCPWLIGPG